MTAAVRTVSAAAEAGETTSKRLIVNARLAALTAYR
jgi:hypothetical protein